jgi:predicted cobalt transporter CbtA
MRMLWLFGVLGVSLVVAALALLAMYLRVRRHMRSAPAPEDGKTDQPNLLQQEK